MISLMTFNMDPEDRDSLGALYETEVVGKNERDNRQIIIKGLSIDCYISNDDSESDYVWIVEVKELLLFLESTLPHEMNREILESLLVQQK